MSTLYQNAYTILVALRERHPQGVRGHELRGHEMSNDDFVVAAEYLNARKAINSNAVPLPSINRHYNLTNASATQGISSPADLLEQDIIAGVAEYVGHTLDPYRLPEPLTSDRTLLEMVIRRLVKRGLLKAIESEDVTTGRRVFSSILVRPEMLEAKNELDYGIQQSAKGSIVQNIQIASGSGNVQISGNNNQVQNTIQQGIDIAQAIQALDGLIALIQASSLTEDQRDFARTDAANLRTELQRKKPIQERINTYWNTLMTTIQGLANIPGLIEATMSLGRQLGIGG